MKFKDIKQYGDLNNQTYRNSIDLENSMITSLEGSPKKIEGYFNCSNNKLTSLEYSPKIIKGYFNCSNNKLFSLEKCPEKISGCFYCYENKLTSLKGSPKEIKGSFKCSYNDLISLEYSPKKINGVFDCTFNKKLKNVREQIIKYQIKAKHYLTDEGNFTFENIKEEFEKYNLSQLKKEQNKMLKQKTNKNKQIKSTDYGLSI